MTRIVFLNGDYIPDHEAKISIFDRAVNFGDAISEWVLAGMGIAEAALWHAGPDLVAGRLVRVLPDFQIIPQTSIWAVRPPGRLMPERARAFLSFMQANIIATNQTRYGALL